MKNQTPTNKGGTFKMRTYTLEEANEDIELLRLGLYSLKFDDTWTNTDDAKVSNMIEVFSDIDTFLFEQSLKMKNKKLAECLQKNIELIHEGLLMLNAFSWGDERERLIDDILELFTMLDMIKTKMEWESSSSRLYKERSEIEKLVDEGIECLDKLFEEGKRQNESTRFQN